MHKQHLTGLHLRLVLDRHIGRFVDDPDRRSVDVIHPRWNQEGHRILCRHLLAECSDPGRCDPVADLVLALRPDFDHSSHGLDARNERQRWLDLVLTLDEEDVWEVHTRGMDVDHA